MSLTDCMDCKRKISALAYVCPNCGRPARKHRAETEQRRWVDKATLQYGAAALATLTIILTIAAVNWEPGSATTNATLMIVSISANSIPFLATSVAILIIVSMAMKTDT